MASKTRDPKNPEGPLKTIFFASDSNNLFIAGPKHDLILTVSIYRCQTMNLKSEEDLKFWNNQGPKQENFASNTR